MKYRYGDTKLIVDATQWTGDISDLETEIITSAGYCISEFTGTDDLFLEMIVRQNYVEYEHDRHALGVPRGWWIVIADFFPPAKMRPSVFERNFQLHDKQTCPVCGCMGITSNTSVCLYCGAQIDGIV